MTCLKFAETNTQQPLKGHVTFIKTYMTTLIEASEQRIQLLRLSITCGLLNSKINGQYVSRFRQSNVRRLLPASDYCRARGNQIKSLITIQTTYSRKLGGAAEHFIDGREKRICRLSFEF